MRSLLRSFIQSPHRLVRVAAYFLAFFAGRCFVRFVFGLFFPFPPRFGAMALESAFMAFSVDFLIVGRVKPKARREP